MKNNVQRIIFFLVITSFHCINLLSQCSCIASNNSFTTLTFPPPWTGANYFNGASFNTYIRLSGAVQGNLYTMEWSNCAAGNPPYLVITSGTANGSFVACGYAPLSYTANASTGTDYFLHVFEDHNCSGSNFNQSCGRLTFNLTSALPVELMSFTGNPEKENKNKLEWVTASELNNDYFEIQTTIDGKNFNTIGTIEGSGTTNTLNYYLFYHRVSSPECYYRLKQVDYDGATSYSEIILVKNENYNEISIWPNPVINKLNIASFEATSRHLDLSVFDINGVLVKQSIHHVDEGFNLVEIEISNEIKSGMYFLLVTDEFGKNETFKFIKSSN
mgnify:CR=1 FL=1